MRNPDRKRRISILLLLAALAAAPMLVTLGGCGEGELFKRNNDLQTRAMYWPDPHVIGESHQNTYGSGGLSSFGPGQNGF